jgi:hypothetical protein
MLFQKVKILDTLKNTGSKTSVAIFFYTGDFSLRIIPPNVKAVFRSACIQHNKYSMVLLSDVKIISEQGKDGARAS